MRRQLSALLAVSSLIGCSTILGIEEIPESSDGGAASGGSAADAGSGGSGASGAAGSGAGGSAGSTATLTLELAGEAGAQGSVSSSPPGIDCPTTCTSNFELGSVVTLTATADASSRFTGWNGAGCSGTGSCEVSLDAAVTVTASFELRRNIAFVTSTTQAPGGIGGLSAADALCTARAQAAGLDGTYIAWLSDSTTNARNRLGNARGWLRPDGKPFTDTVFDLIDGKIFYPLRITETGEDLAAAGGYVATGTNAQGQLTGSACEDYTSAAASIMTGNAAATMGRWTNDLSQSCSEPARLYCFGIDHDAPVAVTPETGRKLFVAPSWTPGGGLADADITCQTEAQAAGLSGKFVALLASGSGSAASRVSASGENFVRPDGVPVAASAALFLAGDLLTTPHQRADGGYVHAYVWTGSQSFGDPAGSNTCTNWSIGDSTVTGYRAEVVFSQPFLESITSTVCSSTARGLLCAEL